MKESESAKELEEVLDKLKATQAQLIQMEKMASLGQLTAGIAHEIKNPLNFVNNFSELSIEYIDEIFRELEKLEQNEVTDEIGASLIEIKSNLGKILQHGQRADGIVRSMLMHSRGGKGVHEPTDLNALIKEYVNLAFHGMRANKNSINVHIQLDLDENVGWLKMNPEDFSRVILNLCKNAFDAMREKLEALRENTEKLKREDRGNLKHEYLPRLIVRTSKKDEGVLIEFEDNGPGVTADIKEKMLEPFFTTKKGNEGTGLGLSITNDIIKSHEGALEIHSKVGEYAKFSILLRKNS